MPTREEARERTGARVLAAAADLFARRGFAAATVRDIAAEAEVSVGTVMAIGDKEALLTAVFDARIADAHAARRAESGTLPRPAGGGGPTEAGAPMRPGPPTGTGAPTGPDAPTQEDGGDGAGERTEEDRLLDRLLDLFRPFVELFTADAELARAYAAVLVSGRHESEVFATLAQALREELGAAFVAHGVSRERADQVADTAYYTYIGVLFAWSAGGAGGPEPLLAAIARAMTPLAALAGSAS